MLRSIRFIRWRLLALLLLLLAACSKEDIKPPCTTPYVAPIPPDAYTFPLRPGMPAWATLTTTDAMVKVLQVPDATLRAISTPGLVSTCLDYPLLSDILLANRLQRGMRSTLALFNGYGELRQRPEAAALLLSRYRAMKAACLPEPGQRGAYSFTFSYVEMILAQDEYLAQLSAAERRSLMREALAKYADKKPLVEAVYGYFGLKTAAFVMARIMQAEQFGPFVSAASADADVRLFTVEAEIWGKTHVLDTVVKCAEQFR